jgi:hypothetical protein
MSSEVQNQLYWNKNSVFLRGEGAEQENVEEAEEDEKKKPWYIRTAGSISKQHSKIQNELLSSQSKLLPYFIEWCETPQPQQRGVAYRDAIVVYDENGRTVTHKRFRSPDLNIYIGVPCKILGAIDPVLHAAMQEAMLVYEHTFWGNAAGMKCCQAAQAIAKRGLNVEQFFSS